MSEKNLPAADGSAATADGSADKRAPLSTRTRVGTLIFVILAVAATLGLAYWQLSRWESTSSFQNLGYALQWPAFGIFFVWAYRKWLGYERERENGNFEAASTVKSKEMSEIPEDFLPTNPDGTRRG